MSETFGTSDTGLATVRTIIAKGTGIHKEALAGGTILPGHLIKRTSTGTYVVHATASEKVTPLFAIENELIGADVNTSYASGATTYAVAAHSGMDINAVLAANAPAIVIGDRLESAGDGTLRKIVPLTAFTNLAGTPATVFTAIAALATAGGNTYTDAAVNAQLTAAQQEIQNLYTRLNAVTVLAQENPIAIALQAVDNSAVSAVAFIKVEVV